HRCLLLIVATHSSSINQSLQKNCDHHQTMSFSAACLAPAKLSLEFSQIRPFSAACKARSLLAELDVRAEARTLQNRSTSMVEML
ncbi:MAG: hypothetical protein P4L51_20060, partial [Puia sp.]|nr:hypothetical protein [Puia sp.]